MSTLTNVNVIKSENATIHTKKNKEKTIYELTALDKEKPLEITFSFPLIAISHFWTPVSSGESYLPNLWSVPLETQINYSMPLFSFLNEDGKMNLVIALSETKYQSKTLIGVHEETACIHLTFCIPKLFDSRQLQIYIDEEKQDFYKGIVKAREWMYQVNDIVPLFKNEKAYQPVYSTWYSFHQSLNQKELEEQRKYFKQNQLQTIILDDGWQTEDSNRRYAYAGDWEIAQKKFPDMKNHIRNFQKEGINYLVWITLPYVGIKAVAFPKFKNKFLYYDEYQRAGVLDPRYPEVREYLIDKMIELIKELNLDGLKIDFIDSFKQQNANVDEKMDFISLEAAIEKLLSELTKQCLLFKPDFLFEYREDYFGPVMNQFANIIRVKDCPNDFNRNRYSIANLRLLCPNAAIHSDMILFHPEDTLTNIAFQLLHSLFGVVQLSVDLTKLSFEQQKIITFWMSYQQEQFVYLFEKEFKPLNPQANYNVIIAGDTTKKIVAKYQRDIVLSLDEIEAKEIDVINATLDESMIFTSRKESKQLYQLTVFNLFGEPVEMRELQLEKVVIVKVPSSGFIRLKKC